MAVLRIFGSRPSAATAAERSGKCAERGKAAGGDIDNVIECISPKAAFAASLPR
jgi:hypothetical protein